MNNKSNNNSLRKLLLTAFIAGPLATLPAPLWALPSTASTNLTTTSGVTSTTAGTTLSFTAPDKSVLTWVNFGGGGESIAPGDTINYILPSSSAALLNLVTGASTTTVGGSLTSNGNVYILNPNGVILANGAQVNAGGFYVSTVSEPLAAAGFQLNGTLSFVGTSTAAVTVNGGNYQALGSGNNTVIYGRNADVNAGNFYGNLTVNTVGGAGQNATFAQTGAVAVNQLGVPASAGHLRVNSNGGNIVLTGTGTAATLGNAPLAAGNVTSLNTAAGQVTVTAGGSGYAANSSIPVTIAAAPTGGTNATGTATTDANGVVTAVTITNAGVGYTAAPTVTLAAPTNFTLTTQGGATLNTVGSAATGSISQGGSRVTTSTSSTGASQTTTINAGTTGTVTLGNVDFGTLAITSAGATSITDNSGGLILGNINITPTNTLAGTAMTNLTLVTANGELSMASGAAVTVNATTAAPNPSISLTSRNSIGFTGSGALTFATIQAATTATISTTGDVNFVSGLGVLADGVTNATSTGINNLSITTTGGKITANNLTGSSTQSLTASGDLLTRNISNATSLVLRSTGGKVTTGAIASTTTSSVTAVGDISTGTYTTTNGAVTFSSTAGKITVGNYSQTGASSGLFSSVGDLTLGTITQTSGALTLTSSTGTVTTGAVTSSASLTINAATDVILAGGTVPVLVVNSSAGKISQSAAITSISRATFNALSDITLTTATNDFNVLVLQNGGGGSSGISVTDANDITLGGGTNTKGATTITAGAGVTAFATNSTTIPVTIQAANLTGTGTTGINQISGIVSSVTVANGGRGYPANATNIAVTIAAPAGNQTATINAPTFTSGAGVTALTANATGRGYTPNTTIPVVVDNTGTGGTGLTAFANIGSTGSVGSIVITNMGTGYTSAPVVTFAAPAVAVVQATGVATTNSFGQITGVTITEPGSNYYATTAPTITFAAPTGFTNAAATGNTNANGALTSISLTGGANTGGAQYSVAPTITLTNGATATATILNGAVSSITPLHSGGITIGTAATDSLVFGNNLTLTSQGPAGTATVSSRAFSEINTVANSVLVSGNVQLNTGGANANLGTNTLGAASNYSFGAIGASTGAGNVSLIENLTLNLGTITTSGNVTANSLGSNIINTGVLTISGALNLYANTLFNPGDVTLSNSSNNITGNIVIQNANNVTVVNPTPATTNLVAGSASVVGKAILGTTSVTGKAINLTVAAGSGGDFNTVGFNASGAVSITDPNSITIANATNTGTGTVSVTAAGTLSLGSGIALNSTGVSTFTATSASANITDTAPNISIFGPAAFISDQGISITKSGHSIGPVSLTSGNVAGSAGSNVDITYTEAGTANLNVVRVNLGGTSASTGGPLAGNLTVVSTAGGVRQTPTTGFISVPFTAGTGANSASFTAASGSGVSLDNTGTGANAIIAPVTIRATTDSSLVNGNVAGANITLNGVAVTGGAFTADVKALAGGTITERSGSTIFVYGNSSFQTNAGRITLDQSGNNFGALTLVSNNTTAAGADIAVTEGGTLNLAGVNTGTAGKLTVVSQNGGIIQTGNTGVTVGTATTASLTAAAGGITLNSGNNFGGASITLSTTGNVTLQDNNANTVLANGTNIGGTLTIRNTANGTLKDSGGGITVAGNVLFDVGTGAIQIVGSGNSFGAVQFRGGNVSIAENTAFNLNAGSVASGQVSLSTISNFITSGLGTSTFAGTTAPSLTVSAGGTITITNPIFVANGLTFRALGAVDLSALSLIGNLNGINPTNLGASSYRAPGP